MDRWACEWMALAGALALAVGVEADQVPVSWTLGGDGEWIEATNWNPRAVPNNTARFTYAVTIDGSDAVDVVVALNMSPTIDTLLITPGDELVLRDSWDLSIAAGLIANDGRLTLASQGLLTDLRLLSDTLLTGSGLLLLSNSPNNRIYGSPGIVRLTNDAAHRIQGSGQLGANLLQLTNYGHVTATLGSFPLTLDTSGTTNVNQGVLESQSGGILAIAGSTIDNTGGVIQALDRSLVTIGGTSVITGGEISSEGSGLVRITGLTTLTGVTNVGQLHVNNDADPIISSSLTNQGPVWLNSTGSNTDLRISGNTSFLGAGELVLSNNKNNRIFGLVASNRLTNGADHTIRGAGQIGANFMAITNDGFIVADEEAGLTIDPSSQGFQNAGVVEVAKLGSLTIAAGPFETTGAVVVNSGRKLTRTGDFVHAGGEVSCAGEIEVNSGSYLLSAGELVLTGVLDGHLVNLGGEITNGTEHGPILIDGDLTQDTDGTVQLQVGGLREGEFDQLNVTGTATLTGTLAVVAEPSYKPQVGDELTVVTAGDIDGQFECAKFLGLKSPNGVQVFYEEDSVRMKVLVVPPTDFNGDNFVDGGDLGILLGAWGTCTELCCTGDLDGDGQVDALDLGILLALWGTDGIVEGEVW